MGYFRKLDLEMKEAPPEELDLFDDALYVEYEPSDEEFAAYEAACVTAADGGKETGEG